MSKNSQLAFLLILLYGIGAGLPLFSQSSAPSQSSHVRVVKYDGSKWHLKGEGVVCCPCAVPCPCRTNDMPTYGHCEAALYLHVAQGHYGKLDMSGVQFTHISGSCSMSYETLSTMYFDQRVSPAQQQAMMEIITSFFPVGGARFPYVTSVPMDAQITGDHLFSITIPHILQMVVDRNWGQPSPPFPFFAADDHFSNLLQYAENLRYIIHDSDAGLNFDYSHRQANYRKVDLGDEQYQSKSMLIQFQNGAGHFTADQMRLVNEQHLPTPDLDKVRVQVAQFKREHRSNNP